MNQEEFNIRTNYPRMAKNFDPLRVGWHMLYDTATKRPLACSTLQGTINGLAQRYPDSTSWYFINSTLNLYGALKVNSSFRPSTAWEWKFNLKTRVFDYMPEQLTLDEVYHYRLTTERAAVLDRLIVGINSFRRPFLRDTIDQTYIYNIKKAEAEEILLTEGEIDHNNFAFVSDYADSIGCDIRVAAGEIIKHSEYQKEAYRKSEAFRLKYSNAIYNASEIVELKAIMSDIDKELMPYIKI